MEKLTIKELAPYLPYRLKVIYNNEETKDIISTMIGIEDQNNILTEKHFVSMNFAFKPILRPLSDLTKEIEHNGEKFVPGLMLVDPDKEDWDKMVCEIYKPFKRMTTEYIQVTHESLGQVISINPNNIEHLPFNIFKNLFEWHFDVFGLIEKGLAVNINTFLVKTKIKNRNDGNTET